ncbi:ester cyclase [Robbsia sp. KACC 23696]|uniref:ester cyclase n=1 Tax=Robbsia sp. KACC 23696 TaxID=3149231 RepID=UPI00325B0230
MSLAETYEAYIACLNARDLDELGRYVADGVIHNGRQLGLSGYREMLVGDYRDIPDLQFRIDFLVVDTSSVASRLHFDCHPKAEFLGVAVNGRHVVFHENVFYRFSAGKIEEVWSVIDKAALEAQLQSLRA